MNNLEAFTNQFPVSKTLGFKLLPQGKTFEHIKANKLIEADVYLAELYKKAKAIIDRYHREFTEKAMSGMQLSGLEELAELYSQKKAELDKKAMDTCRANLRGLIADCFSKSEKPEVVAIWENLFKKELITKDLMSWNGVSEEDKSVLTEFKSFTTYFDGYHDTRGNIYTSREISTSIAFRIIHNNFPKFLDNVKIYALIKNNYPALDFTPLEVELKDILKGAKLDEVFTLGFFNKTLSQTGINFYNNILSGQSFENQQRIRGINEYVNDYRSKNALLAKQLPKFNKLWKQILGNRESISFSPTPFETGQEVLDSIQMFYTCELRNYPTFDKSIDVMQSIGELLLTLKKPDTDKSKIFIQNDQCLTRISTKIFGDWAIIEKALDLYYAVENPIKTKKVTQKYLNEKGRWLKSKYFSISQIEKALLLYKPQNEVIGDKITDTTICDYFALFGKEQRTGELEPVTLFDRIEKSYAVVEDLLNTTLKEGREIKQETSTKTNIQNFLDNIIGLLHLIKPLCPKDIVGDKDEVFYSDFNFLFEQLNIVTPLYNKTKSYMTSTVYSIDKTRLNFSSGNFLDGWAESKEEAHGGIILKKDGLYYLAIMDKYHRQIFRKIPVAANNEPTYDKMVYKSFGGASQTLPRICFTDGNNAIYNPSADMVRIRKRDTYLKGDIKNRNENFSLKDCHAIIDFFKQCIAKTRKYDEFNFKFSETSTYTDISGFYREVDNQGDKIEFRDVPVSYIDQMVDDGKLYLFQIYNKDFSPKSKGKPNLHTSYWKMLFDERNLKTMDYRLNGGAMVFFRPKSITYSDIIMKDGHHAAELKGKFPYAIIKDKRFTEDSFHFHVPITLNSNTTGRTNINERVLNYIQNNPDVNIIGIDRGERNLLYLTLIDQQGNIKVQRSLNEIIAECNGINRTINYHDKLTKREGEMDLAQKLWGNIGKIKDLKGGYLSQVVHLIAEWMVNYNAILVMEDLSMGFMRSRQDIRKEVYQRFEGDLLKKLNYLVFKNISDTQPGGLLKALQLSNKFVSFDKLKSQSGFVFYLPAPYTSKICPATGFVNFLNTKYEKLDTAKKFFNSFDSIKYNQEKDWFEFSFDYNNFTTKAEGTRTKWTVCTTNETRYDWNKTRRSADAFEITPCLKKLFDDSAINYTGCNDLREAISSQKTRNFFEELLKLLRITLSLRHNNGKKGAEEQDFILSPVDKNGVFFDSRNADATQPMNADANGSFHIALKGLWAMKKINNSQDLKTLKLSCTNKEWINFAQEINKISTFVDHRRCSPTGVSMDLESTRVSF